MVIALWTLAAAADTFSVGQLSFETENSSEVTCKGFTATALAQNPTTVTIPGRVRYNGTEYRVRTVASAAFRDNTKLTRVFIDWGVRQVLANAFSGCTALAYVNLPSSIEMLYGYSFRNCTSMLQFQLAGAPPMTTGTPFTGMRKCSVITAMRANVAAYNSNSTWTAIDSDGSITYNGAAAYDFEGSNGTRWVITSPVNTSSGSALATLVGLAPSATFIPMADPSNDVPKTIGGCSDSYRCKFDKVAPYACNGHTSLRTIGRTDSGSYGFRLTNVGQYAFANCPALISVTIPAESIDNCAFYRCTALTTIQLYQKGYESNGTKALGTMAFRGAAVTEVYIPSSLTTYGSGAFCDCPNLKKFTVSTSNANFANDRAALYSKDKTILYQVGGAWYNAGRTELSSGIYSDEITSIADYAFFGNTQLNLVCLPYGVTSIGMLAFGNMTRLTTLVIPGSVTMFDSHALWNLTNLRSLVFNQNVVPAALNQTDALTGLRSGAVLSVPTGRASYFTGNSIWNSAFAEINGGTSFDFMTDDYNETDEHCFFSVTSTQPYTDATVQSAAVDGTVKMVAPWSVWDASYEASLTIPTTVKNKGKTYMVTEIDADAFTSYSGALNLTSISGGKGVKTIGANAFSACSNLNSVNFPNPVYFGQRAFYNCKKLTNITLGDRLAGIGASAFENCTALTGRFSLPESTSYIGARAFAGCTALNILYISRTGTTTFGDDAFPQTSNTYFSCFVPMSQYRDILVSVQQWPNPPTSGPRVFPYLRATGQYTAFSCYTGLDLPSDAEFYYVSGIDSNSETVTTKRITGMVPAGTGLLMKTVPGAEVTFNPATTSQSPISDNRLKAVTTNSVTLSNEEAGNAATDIFRLNPSTQRFERITQTTTFKSGETYFTNMRSKLNPLDNVSAFYLDALTTIYPVAVNRKTVTSNNAANLSVIHGVTGQVSYIPSTRTLRLQNATINYPEVDYTNQRAISFTGAEDLNLQLIGSNTINNPNKNSKGIWVLMESVDKKVRLYGGGKLKISTENSTQSTLTSGIEIGIGELGVEDVQIDVVSTGYGICGYYQRLNNPSRFKLSGEATVFKANGLLGSIKSIHTTINSPLSITVPANGVFDHDYNVVAGNELVKDSYVVISKPEAVTYDLWINGTQVTKANANQLTQIDGVNGAVSFNPTTRTLTLNNATITNTTSGGRCIKSDLDSINIVLVGENTLTAEASSSAAAIEAYSAKISGSGTLTATGYRAGIYFHPNSTITIDNVPGLTLTGNTYGISTTSPTNTALVIRGANTVFKAVCTSTGAGRGALRNIRRLVLEDGLAITEPVGGYFSDNILRDASGATATSATITKPSVNPYHYGDVNGDNSVDIADLNIVINVTVGKTSPTDYPRADLTNDGKIDVSDLNEMINILLK